MATDLLPNDQKTPVEPNESDEVFTSRHGQEVARGLEDLENHANGDNGGSENNKPVSKQEGEPNKPTEGGYYNNFTGQQKSELKGINGAHFLRRKGPIGLIISLVVGGGMGFSALFSPGLLIVQMKEVMVDKFNTQLASMDVRTTKLISAKIDSTTGGICTNGITIKCKYSTMSDKQVAKFKAAGITVESTDTSITGRAKPTGFKFGDKVISPAEFNKALREDSGFRSAVRNAYNPKYAGFSDSKWKKYADRLKLSKKNNVTGSTDEERAKKLQETTKNGISQDRKSVTAGKDPACPDCAELTQAEADSINAEAEKLTSEANSGAKAGGAALEEVGGALEAGERGLSSLGNIFKVTGVVDTACQAYGAVQTVGYAAKTIRAVQLARYAMAFLNTADMIKAGTAKPEDVAYMGGILTQIAYDAKSAVSRGAATDSFGYKYAAYGSTNKMTAFSSQFLAGGGLTGDLITFTSIINDKIPGNPKQTCGKLANPWVQAGSFIGGVALMFVPVVGQTASFGKLAVQGALGVTLSVGLMVLPNLLKDIVAGNGTDGIVGASSGDAITSGSGGLFGGVANNGGNGALSKDDAVEYNSLQLTTLSNYANDEIATLSPFDTSSRHTFMGSIVSALIPSMSSAQGIVGNSISTIGSILSSSISGIIPKTNALSTEDYRESLNMCQDYDYNEMGIATDPFCNVIYGIPPKYLNKDPLVVIEELGDLVDLNTGEPLGEYKEFTANCIERTEPLASTGPSQQVSAGDECVISDSNANYYLHYVDQRVNNGMDGYDTPDSSTSAPEPVSIGTPSTANASIDQTQLFTDSTGIACASGTTDAGLAVGYHSGKPINIRLCSIPNTEDGNNSNQLMRVNSRVSGAFLALTAAMGPALGQSPLHVSDSFRTMAGQQAAFARYGSPRAARPGFSNHQMGLAIDFQLSTGNNSATKTAGRDRVYDWLTANAGSYGIAKYEAESWHWQPTGAN